MESAKRHRDKINPFFVFDTRLKIARQQYRSGPGARPAHPLPRLAHPPIVIHNSYNRKTLFYIYDWLWRLYVLIASRLLWLYDVIQYSIVHLREGEKSSEKSKIVAFFLSALVVEKLSKVDKKTLKTIKHL